jgi:polar amino acid transport system substrate-binding protein
MIMPATRHHTRRFLSSALGAAAVAAVLRDTAVAHPAQEESTIDRVRRTGVLRIAVLPGEAPFFRKDLTTGEWSGAALDMARSIAGTLGVKLAYVEGTYASSVLDLQANKVDLAFALNPTPMRALAIGFSRPYFMNPISYLSRPSFDARTWADLNRPEVRVVSLIGSSSDPLLAHYAPKAQVIGAKDGDQAVLLMQSGRADCVSYGLLQALGASVKIPELNKVVVLREPHAALPSSMGMQEEPDRRFRDFIDSWADYNNGVRMIAGWLRDGLLAMGVKPETIPSDAWL